jgi:hypothetical protein
LRAAIREQVGAIVKRLGRQDAIESVGAGRVSKWKPTAIRTQQDGQNQHALMMELARGELPYGQFVQDSTRITVRMAVAIQPFIQEGEAIEQVAMVPQTSDQGAAAFGVFVGNLLGAAVEIFGDAADAGVFGGSRHYHGGGAALLEEFVYDASGQPLSVILADYLMPTIAEIPTIEVSLFEDAPRPLNPLGVKGAGEAGIAAVGAAIAAAVDDALGRAGAVRPVRPRAVLRRTMLVGTAGMLGGAVLRPAAVRSQTGTAPAVAVPGGAPPAARYGDPA